MKWEYKLLSLQATGFWKGGGIIDQEKFEMLLNELGKDGWELVTSFDTNKNYGETKNVISIFKREARY